MSSFIKHIIVQGETLQSVAQDELGDYSQWYSIAQLNNLKYPYIVDTVAEKLAGTNVLTFGDTLMISLPDITAQNDLIASMATMPQFDQDELLALALGKDLDIMPLTDTTVTAAQGLSYQTLEMKGDGHGGIAIVRALDNLKQSLFIRLITPKGSYVGHPEYGSQLDMYLGLKNTEENAQLIDLEIERTLWTDSRVTNVEFNGHTVSGNSYTGSFAVYTMSNQQAFQFVVGAQQNGPVVLLDNFNQYSVQMGG